MVALFDPDELASIQDGLLDALLSTAPVSSVKLESILTVARRALLTDVPANSNDRPAPLLSFASAIAQQCFINEYIFDIGDAESADVDRLRDEIANAIHTGETIDPLRLAILASYMALNALPDAVRLASREWPKSIQPLIAQQILDDVAEKEIRPSIERITAIADGTSEKVRAQYEESPYPRWTRVPANADPMPLDRYIQTQFPGVPYKAIGNGPIRLLVAGCGTGMHALTRAMQFRQVNVLAIDLSLSSLSYAIRKTRELGITNIRYGHADILALDPSQTFDVIDSSGVLHHLRDPFEGWRRLAAMLRPGGLMHIGLYSTIARRDVKIAREQLAAEGRQFSPAAVRKLRADIMTSGHPLSAIARFSDFFSMSECRDLLFHIQEHQLSIPQIAEFLKVNGFSFLGFETLARNAYLKRFPQDRTATDLANWATFEVDNPATFAQMYQFWIQKN